MSFVNECYRKVVFFFGDVKKLHSFPYVTWAAKEHKVSYDEILQALPLIEYGDVGIHRDAGYMSNVFIPGFMKHAWIHTQDGIESPKIVEAISEGVIERSPIYPMFSDYTIILSPRNCTAEERKGACTKANGIIGQHYDHNFKFNIEKELDFYRQHNGTQEREAEDDLKEYESKIQKYDHAFSCTEAVSYAWWHKREILRLYRHKQRGKEVILADDFLNHGWEIKWMSNSVTLDVAKKLGLHEEGLGMIEEYRKLRMMNYEI